MENKININLSPIVLFVYNRLWHTQQTIEALKKNELAKDSELFIYADGNKTDTTKKDVGNVRQYLKSINGFKKTTIIERDKNLGLADNIISGVTEIVNQYGKIIVLEDDIVTSPFFLKFMNTALDFYKRNEKIMTISSYLFPIDSINLKETFLLKSSACWGWATWKRAWKYFDNNIDNTINKFTKEDIDTLNLDGTFNFWQQVVENKKGKLKTWAIFWYTSMYLNDGLTLFPKKSFSENIGHDNSGVHCSTSNIFDTDLMQSEISYFPTIISEDMEARSELKKYFKKINPPFYKHFYNKIVNYLKAI